MNKAIERIKREHNLAIPKDRYSIERVKLSFGEIAQEDSESWLVSCSHTFGPPATASEINETEIAIGLPIPNQYKEFLRISNGANLYRTTHIGYKDKPYIDVRFPLFSCRELVEFNCRLHQRFKKAYDDDPEFENVRKLNYMAVCNACDANFQSLLLDGVQDDRVFMLFHELIYRPFSDKDTEWYYTIAPSLSSWLELISASRGWEGRGSWDSSF